MHSFVDNVSRTWAIDLNVTCLKRVRALCEVDLMAVVDGRLLERLVTDPILLCDVLYAVCKDQADERDVTDEQFGRAMAGDVIDLATKALLEALVDFFPQRKRGVLARAVAKLRQFEARALAVAESRFDNPKLDELMEKALQEAGDSFMTSQDLSALIQDPSP